MKLSLKNKLWWAQNKDRITRIGIISITALILVVSVIYFTYSKFTAKNEATAYETTVEKFTKNDFFIASYIDGEWSDRIPDKDEDYAVDKVVCDNDATGTWDEDKWMITIGNAKTKTKCVVYFVTPPKYYAFGEPTASSTTDYNDVINSSGSRVFIQLSNNKYSICYLNEDSQLSCVKFSNISDSHSFSDKCSNTSENSYGYTCKLDDGFNLNAIWESKISVTYTNGTQNYVCSLESDAQSCEIES